MNSGVSEDSLRFAFSAVKFVERQVDGVGRAVVVELKRGNDKFQLLQAIAHAGMIAKWKPQELVRRAGSWVEGQLGPVA